MKTIVLSRPQELAMIDAAPPPAPAEGEALVQVRRIGICGTDLHAYRGRQPFFTYPRVLGHELGVEVLETGPGVDRVQPGDRCAVEPYLNCGRCIACRRNRPNCCAHLRVLGVHVDGGMRERLIVPAHKLHPSTRLDLDHLALVETLAIGAHACARAALEPGENVLVIGAGPIGLSVIRFALEAGARLIVMDLDRDRLDFCRRHFALEDLLQPDDQPLDRVRHLTDGDGPTVVFDATGSAQSMTDAFNYVASGGRLVLVGLVRQDITFNDPEFHRRELTILSSRNATPADFSRVIALLEQHRLSLLPWITHRAPLEETADAFPRFLQPQEKVVKAMLVNDP